LNSTKAQFAGIEEKTSENKDDFQEFRDTIYDEFIKIKTHLDDDRTALTTVKKRVIDGNI